LPNPTLTLRDVSVQPGVVVAVNSVWGGTSELANAFTQAGAFPYLVPTSRDAALLRSGGAALAPGNYTVQVSDAARQSGIVLTELYDATPTGTFTATTPRLINLSVLKHVGSGDSLTAGFTIGGATAKTVLIRAVGPSLGFAPFNITDAMIHPTMTLVRTSTGATVASNSGWEGDPQLSHVADRVGAFAITRPQSKDSMLLVTLVPDAYVVRVAAASGTPGGITFVEIYDVP
jgi:hypothetical protein